MSDSFNGGYNGTPAPPPPAPPKSSKHTVPVWAWITGGVLLVAIIVLITVLFTGGDDKKDETAPQPAPTVTVTEEAPEPSVAPLPKETIEAAAPKDVTTKEGFIDFVRSEYPVLKTVPDAEIVERAERTCNLLDDGATFMDVVEDGVKDATSAEEAEGFGAISGGGIAVLCPEHYDEIAPYM